MKYEDKMVQIPFKKEQRQNCEEGLYTKLRNMSNKNIHSKIKTGTESYHEGKRCGECAEQYQEDRDEEVSLLDDQHTNCVN
jgi:hypothetical protein